LEVEFHFKELCKKKSKFTGEQRVRILMEVEGFYPDSADTFTKTHTG
jgi:hypothetical protein